MSINIKITGQLYLLVSTSSFCRVTLTLGVFLCTVRRPACYSHGNHLWRRIKLAQNVSRSTCKSAHLLSTSLSWYLWLWIRQTSSILFHMSCFISGFYADVIIPKINLTFILRIACVYLKSEMQVESTAGIHPWLYIVPGCNYSWPFLEPFNAHNKSND